MKQIKIYYLVAFCISSLYVNAQQKDIALANEYFSVNDFAKSAPIYQKYVVKDAFRDKVYENYRISQIKLKEYASLLKTLKKINKKQPDLYLVLVDLLHIEKLGDFKKDYNKDYKRIYNLVKDDDYTLYKVAENLQNRKLYTEYIQIIKSLRKAKKSKTIYSQELMAIYRLTGNKQGLIEEGLALIRRQPNELERIENLFQTDFQVDDYTILEKKLFEKISDDPHFVYRELLVWYYLQQKEFYDAFVQQRAIDISKKEKGYGLLKIAKIASSNEAYLQAIEILEYTCQTYREQEIFVTAKTNLIEIKELQAKANYPVDVVQINQLVTDYSELLKIAQNQNEKARIEQNQSVLYAFYLHDNNKALALLTKITKTAGISRNQQAKAWLLLGDVYLLDNQIGEASLTYFSIEKRWKNSTYAEEAKYKNALLYFYTGEFDLSESMLDILKRATTREISNDAIDLSLFIKANSGLDTSYRALQLYADADLLVYQKKYTSAITVFDELLTKFNNHSLTDEVYWKKAQVYAQINQKEQQIEQLKLLINKFGKDIWADDAVFQLAKIYDKKSEKSTAMQYYKMILLDYKGSIYTEQARKAYRKLRGDGI